MCERLCVGERVSVCVGERGMSVYERESVCVLVRGKRVCVSEREIMSERRVCVRECTRKREKICV